MSGPGEYELDRVRELGNPLLKTLYDNGILEKPLIVASKKFSDNRPYARDPENPNQLLLNVDHLKKLEEKVRDSERFKRANPEEQGYILDNRIRSYIFSRVFRYARSGVAPSPKAGEIEAEYELQTFIATLCFEYDPVSLIKSTVLYGRRNKIDVTKLDEKDLMKVDKTHAYLFGMLATLSDMSLEEKRREARYLMGLPSSEIPKRLSAFVADGLRRLNKYKSLIETVDVTVQTSSTETKTEQAQQSVNTTKQAVTVLILISLGTLFLFPQLPNQITSAFVLLPTTNLLFLNFLVTILVIVLIYLFTHERESLNY